MLKRNIKETIIVEGKTDVDKLSLLVNANFITTNGSAINQQTLELIKKVNDANGVILFLDPDYVGENIRKKITSYIPKIKQAFITKNDIEKGSKKIGIAEANSEAILNALENVITFNKTIQTISLEEWNELNIDSKLKRKLICNYYKISYCNNKQLFKRLNMMQIEKQEIFQIIKNDNK